MRTMISAVSLAFALTVPACALAADPVAKASFVDAEGKPAGTATLTGLKTGVLIHMEVSGLPASRWVAFHIHDAGKCEGPEFTSAGGHFNPTKHSHGLTVAEGPHAGDMPNQYVGADGVLRAEVFNGEVRLDDGATGIVGRALMIHASPDDYAGQPAGNAGKRIACAVITN